ncbi:SGNH hydrolase domain-containing protein [Microbacterium sp. A82]|uniref:SGNH hydrolase domain-containing protein n=1 Tax=Microbacterium sp. A82 TaxID=3450452 RepID=UPI003F3D4558
MSSVSRAIAATALLGIMCLSGCSTQISSGGTGTFEPQLGNVALDDHVRDATVLVVGDSLAHALGEGMAAVVAAGEPRNVTIVNAAIGGCGILLPEQQQVGGVMAPTNPECNTWQTRWPELVQEYQPDYVYFTTSFWDVAQQILEEGDVATSIADEDVQQRWIDNASEAIDTLSAGGAHVFLDDINSDAMYGVQSRTAEANTSVAVTLLSLRGQICTENGCPPSIDGIQVFDDTGHPAGESRDRLARWILNQMFATS